MFPKSEGQTQGHHHQGPGRGAPRRNLPVQVGSQGRPERCPRWPGRRAPPFTEASAGAQGRSPPARPNVPSGLTWANFRRRGARNGAPVPLWVRYPDRGPAPGAHSSRPSGRAVPRGPGGRREVGGQRGPGTGGPEGPPPKCLAADSARPGQTFPRLLPGPLPAPGARAAPRPPRRRPAGSPGQQAPAALPPRRVRAPRAAAHLSRGSIQLVLRVLWSM